MLKVWDWMSGVAQYDIPVLDAVRPFAAKPERNEEVQVEESKPKAKKKADESAAPEPPRYVLVIHRIATVQHAGEPYLIFNYHVMVKTRKLPSLGDYIHSTNACNLNSSNNRRNTSNMKVTRPMYMGCGAT